MRLSVPIARPFAQHRAMRDDRTALDTPATYVNARSMWRTYAGPKRWNTSGDDRIGRSRGDTSRRNT